MVCLGGKNNDRRDLFLTSIGFHFSYIDQLKYNKTLNRICLAQVSQSDDISVSVLKNSICRLLSKEKQGISAVRKSFKMVLGVYQIYS